jgi:hypothetical protein
VAFRGKETASGLYHLALGLKRRLLNLRQDYYVAQLQTAWPDCPVKESPACHVCGFAQVEVELPNGWLWQGCSAGESGNLLKSHKFKQWLEQLPLETKAIQSLTI